MRLLETWKPGLEEEVARLLAPGAVAQDLLGGLPGVLERYQAIRDTGDAGLQETEGPRSWSADLTLATRVFDELDPDYRDALRRARESILDFYQRQRPNSWFTTGHAGEIYGQSVAPLRSAAFVFSRDWRFSPTSLMMYLAPAYVAGVEDLYINLPADLEGNPPPDFAVALAWDWDVKVSYNLDPVDAVLAFACGTETIPQVDTILCNGGLELRQASLVVGDRVSAKVIADSNETAILADVDADARVLAVDLFALSEDPALTRLAVLTPSMVLASELEDELAQLATSRPEGEAARARLEDLGVIVLTRSLDEALDLVARYPPKHLSLFVESPLDLLNSVHHAGVVYLGRNTPAGIEHYFASASNLIPASGAVALRGPLGVQEFMKTSSLVYYNPRKLQEMHEVIAALAKGEDLPFHESAFRIRIDP